MTSEGRFWQYLADIDKQATEMFNSLVEQMKEKEDISEQLKEENQILWIERMNDIQSRATEIVNAELIYI
ncbi:MAG: TnpV protein [Clostridia bacterium]|nr:TnpV protein [Clostridia bacterium]